AVPEWTRLDDDSLPVVPAGAKRRAGTHEHGPIDGPVIMGPRFRGDDRTGLVLEAISGLEDPPNDRQADDEEQDGHRQAQAYAHVGGLEEAPAEAADEINNWIAQGEGLPGRGQDIDRIKRAAQKGQRRDDQKRHDLQLLESVRP